MSPLPLTEEEQRPPTQQQPGSSSSSQPPDISTALWAAANLRDKTEAARQVAALLAAHAADRFNRELANRLFLQTIQSDRLQIAEMLLDKEGLVDPSFRESEAVQLLAMFAFSNDSLADKVLADPRVDPGAADNNALYLAVDHDNYMMQRKLIAHPKVDPAAHNNIALTENAEFGRLDIVDTLLEDDRVLDDPSTPGSILDNDIAVRWRTAIVLLGPGEGFDVDELEGGEAVVQCSNNDLVREARTFVDAAALYFYTKANGLSLVASDDCAHTINAVVKAHKKLGTDALVHVLSYMTPSKIIVGAIRDLAEASSSSSSF